MSYAHTKRRKLIAKLKRKNPFGWRKLFALERNLAIKKLEGPFLGSAADMQP